VEKRRPQKINGSHAHADPHEQQQRNQGATQPPQREGKKVVGSEGFNSHLRKHHCVLFQVLLQHHGKRCVCSVETLKKIVNFLLFSLPYRFMGNLMQEFKNLKLNPLLVDGKIH